MERIKLLAEIVQTIVQTLAVIGAGIWAYLRFVSNREDETALEISYAYRSENYATNAYVLALEIGFANRGKVRVVVKAQGNPAYSTGDEIVRYGGDLLIRAVSDCHASPASVDWFPTSNSKSPAPDDLEFNLLDEFTENQQTDFWLEPGETAHIGKTMILAPGHYQAMVTFIGDRGEHEFWRRLFYIQVPGVANSSG